MFRRPDSDDEDGYYPRSTSFDRGGSSKRDALQRQLGQFTANKFVQGSEQSQADFYGKQEIKRGEGDDNAEQEKKALTEDEKNKISAKILKAEMKGDKDLVRKLRRKLEGRDEESERPSSSRDKEKTVVMMKRDRAGNVVPASRKERSDDRRDKSSHSGMKREFGKDQDLDAMVREEKTGTAEDQLRMFERALVSSSKIKRHDDESVDDIAEMQKSKRKHDEKDARREEKKMRKQHNILERALDECRLCIESKSLQKQCVVAVGITTYLTVPSWDGLDEEHLLIVPQGHCASSIQLDENVYEEMRLWRKGLTAMFRAAGKDCVFMEMARDVAGNKHMCVECVPLDQEMGDVAPVYFKKAINECEGEYTDNKKLIEIKDIRKQIPKGFSYFTVDFGMQNGFAHVIENQDHFPATFGTELSFEDQKKNMNRMKEMWADFDWTKRIKRE